MSSMARSLEIYTMSDGELLRVFSREWTCDLFIQNDQCLTVVLEDGLEQTKVGAGKPVMRLLH